MKVKAGNWAFILLLAIAPVIVTAITITQTDISEMNPLLGNLAPPINPWIDDLPVSIIPTVLLATLSWFVAFISTSTGFKTSRILIKVVTMGILVALALGVLWLGIVSTHLWIVLKYRYVPVIGLPIIDFWVWILGTGWTGGIILFAFLCFRRQIETD
ncbi:MAG: hypothetical protein GY832_04485 [Chloroflexi bacterium]|nr:hypothetical protein [Chloroflexota bacterium]